MKPLPKLITLASLTLTFWCFSDKIASKLIYISYNLNPFAKKLNEPIKTTEKPSPLEFKIIKSHPETDPTNRDYLPFQEKPTHQIPQYKEDSEPLYNLNYK